MSKSLESAQFNPDQQARALVLLERMAWADMDNAIRGVEVCLRLALEATVDDIARWEHELGPAFEGDGFDEITLPRELIEEMRLEEKLAYVARLLRTVALYYGVDPLAEFSVGGLPILHRESPLEQYDRLEADATSPGALLRALNDLLWMPVTTTRERE